MAGIKVAVHVRASANKTNMRSEALGRALADLGLPVHYSDRGVPVKGSELVIQTGFANSVALQDAIERRVPYLVMEAPFFRDFYDVDKASSWGYNGLAGGAWRPKAPSTERPAPQLAPMKTEGKTLIIGQKPTDHSLRGSDHVKWLLDRFTELPMADFRPHPLCVPAGTLVPIAEALQAYNKVVTYTSTVGVDALVLGCEVRADHRSSPVHNVRNREEWLHSLSWAQGPHSGFGELAAHILSGYDEARTRMLSDLFETPRERVNGQAVSERYHRLVQGER